MVALLKESDATAVFKDGSTLCLQRGVYEEEDRRDFLESHMAPFLIFNKI